MKISAVYIAKNESKNITRSLESVKDAVDELILVDTGSTDDTVKIFRSYGGQVFYRPWDDDFSAPRNLALSKATGDWIIILDADESFSEITRKNIKGVLASCAPKANGLLINKINFDEDNGEFLDEFYDLRIVRNIKGLNYKGIIHERLYIEGEVFYGAQRVAKELLIIEHTGYSSSISVEKSRRNIRLMEAAIAKGDPEERYYTNLYESYMSIGDTEKALYYARLDVERGRQPFTYASRSYRGLMSYYSNADTMEKKLARCKLTAQAVKDFPELPDFHAEHSESLFQLGRYREAKLEIDKALALYQDYDGIEPCLLTKEMITLMEKRQEEMTVRAEKHGDIKITACVIVKNEDNNIRAWLDNVSTFADEIIINDTGSEDKTKKIIEEFSDNNSDVGIVLIESLWQDDFSFSKNQCLVEAKGDWIVFTDADELFVNPELIKGYISSINVEQDLQVVFVPMVNVDTDDNDNIINRFNSLRIFRNIKGMHYEGRIHENLVLNNEEVAFLKSKVAPQSLLIKHTGYSSNINYTKARRNLQLLLLDIEEGQDIRKLYFYLAQCYYTLKDYQRTLENALLAIQSEYQPMGLQGDTYWLALNAMEKLDYQVEDKMVLADNGIKLFPQLPDFYIRKGILLFEENGYHAAVRWFAKAETLIAEYNNGSFEISSNFMSVLHEYYAVWGRCLYKTGYSQAAEEKFKQALKINPWYDRAICYWADIYQGRLDKELLNGLSEIYNILPNSSEVLSNIFGTNGFPELAGYYGGDHYSLLKERDYEKIYNNSMKEMAEMISSLSVCLLESYNEGYVVLLPKKLQNLIKFFHNIPISDDIADCFEAYTTILPEVLTFATEEISQKYLAMLGVYSSTADENEEKKLIVADKLMDIQKYEMANDFYQQVPSDSSLRDERYWQNVGICLYGFGKYQEALESLQWAVKNKKTATYEIWCQEAMKNGN